jgi:hypothetical protein
MRLRRDKGVKIKGALHGIIISIIPVLILVIIYYSISILLYVYYSNVIVLRIQVLF